MITDITERTQLENYTFADVIESMKMNASDVLKKIDRLGRSLNPYGIAVVGYPAGATLSIVERVCRLVKDVQDFDTFVSKKKAIGQDWENVLVRNYSPLHSEIEKMQQRTGGLYSEIITDLGDFRIAKVVNGKIKSAKDYSLYKVEEGIFSE